jgi:hypothetical protein
MTWHVDGPSGLLVPPRPFAPPAIHRVPETQGSAAEEALEFCADVGLIADPWQEFVLRDMLGERYVLDPRTGVVIPLWAAKIAGVEVPRQNGKGSIIEIREIAGICLWGEKLISHTAHELKTAEEARLRMEQIIDEDESGELKALWKKTVRTNGKEAIEFKNGARIKYIARSDKSGRGFSGDVVILDEAMFLEAGSLEALIPTLATRANPQVLLFGSAGMEHSDAWRRLRTAGMEGSDDPMYQRLFYVAWCILPEQDPEGGTIMPDLDDRENWWKANPGYGVRITEEFIAELERGMLTASGFARERLGIWDLGDHEPVIPIERWQANMDRESRSGSNLVFAFDVTPDRTSGSISSMSTNPATGRGHLEVIENKNGVGWIPGRLDALRRKHKPAKIVVNPASPAGSLITECEGLGMELHQPTGREAAQACGSFYDAAMEGDKFRHVDQPLLNLALGAADKRPYGKDGWTWWQVDQTDITPLTASTLALLGYQVVLAEKPVQSFVPKRIR